MGYEFYIQFILERLLEENLRRICDNESHHIVLQAVVARSYSISMLQKMQYCNGDLEACFVELCTCRIIQHRILCLLNYLANGVVMTWGFDCMGNLCGARRMLSMSQIPPDSGVVASMVSV